MKKAHNTELTFKNFDSFIEQCKKPALKGCKYDASKQTNREKFTGTKTYNEAVKIASLGWPEGTKKMKKGLLEFQASEAPQLKSLFDVSGDEPDIDRFLSGEPENMISWENVQASGVVFLDVYFSFSYSCGKKQDAIIKRGVQILSNVDQLEQNGYRVRIIAYERSTDPNGNTFELNVTLKDYQEVIDLDRMAFAMAHPAMLRRLGFRLIEQIPHKNYDHPNYGSVEDLKKDDVINITPNTFEPSQIDDLFKSNLAV
jgi:hypothetical protein